MAFDQVTLDAVAVSLRAGQYNLLLGAGVSLDSKNYKGENLPSADTFRLDLCKLKGANPRSSLQRVYSTLTEQEVAKYVVDRFRQCQPGPSVQKLTNFLWR